MTDCVILKNVRLGSLSHSTHSSSLNTQFFEVQFNHLCPSLQHPRDCWKSLSCFLDSNHGTSHIRIIQYLWQRVCMSTCSSLSIVSETVWVNIDLWKLSRPWEHFLHIDLIFKHLTTRTFTTKHLTCSWPDICSMNSLLDLTEIHGSDRQHSVWLGNMFIMKRYSEN